MLQIIYRDLPRYQTIELCIDQATLGQRAAFRTTSQQLLTPPCFDHVYWPFTSEWSSSSLPPPTRFTTKAFAFRRTSIASVQRWGKQVRVVNPPRWHQLGYHKMYIYIYIHIYIKICVKICKDIYIYIMRCILKLTYDTIIWLWS